MQCAYYHSEEIVKSGMDIRQGQRIQPYWGQTYDKRFNDWTHIPVCQLL